jgi:hypothetical protein
MAEKIGSSPVVGTVVLAIRKAPWPGIEKRQGGQGEKHSERGKGDVIVGGIANSAIDANSLILLSRRNPDIADDQVHGAGRFDQIIFDGLLRMMGHARLQEGLYVIDPGLSPGPRREGMS